MSHFKVVASVGLVAALALAAAPPASAQDRGRAQPRRSARAARPPARVVRPPVRVAPYWNYYYRTHRPSVNLGFFYGSPGYYGLYDLGGPMYGYNSRPYRYAAPYGYGFSGYSGRPYGGVRIDVPQRDAEVLVDGYFVGTVDDFDGRFQQANLEAGPHRIEIRGDGLEPIAFDVNVQPGRTITYRSSMRPLEP